MVKAGFLYQDCLDEEKAGTGYRVDPILGLVGTAVTAELANGTHALLVVCPFSSNQEVIQDYLDKAWYRFPDVFPAHGLDPHTPTL